MRKHYKLISSIVCLMLCVCMVTFGVYAARFGLVTLNSSVSFSPTTAKLKIFGGIAGQEGFNTLNSSKQIYYACNYGKDEDKVNYETRKDVNNVNKDVFADWEFETIYFADYLETADKTHPDPICFYLQITNFVETRVNYRLTLNNPSSGLSYAFAYEIEDNTSDKLTNPDISLSKGWWCIKNNSASKPTFHNNETKPGKNHPIGAQNGIVDFSSIDTTLKTIMIVVQIGIINIDESLMVDNFSFTITATAQS